MNEKLRDEDREKMRKQVMREEKRKVSKERKRDFKICLNKQLAGGSTGTVSEWLLSVCYVNAETYYM